VPHTPSLSPFFLREVAIKTLVWEFILSTSVFFYTLIFISI
jgi:hypothetical protein